MEDIDSALDYLYSFINYEKDTRYQYNNLYYNIERTNSLLKALENPEKLQKIIHVTGTKGKGSVCMIMQNLLMAHGYTTGLFLSPHIERVNERIVVNEEEIDDNSFIELLNILKPIIDKLSGKKIPTTFEILTAMAMMYFYKKNVDYSILEAGMGGRFDSTNFCDPVVSVITSVSYDHMDKLGNTIEDIAKEKAGIIKKGRPVVVGIQKYPVYPIFEETAKIRNSNLYKAEDLCNYSILKMDENGSVFDANIDGVKFKEISTSLFGRHQIENIVLALLTLKIIGLLPDEKVVKKRLSLLNFKTRFEIIKKKNRLFILDSAHNEESAKRLIEAIRDHFKRRKVTSIVGIVKGKDVAGIIKNISSLADKIIITNPITHRELETNNVYEIAKSYKNDTTLIDSINDAISNAISNTKGGEIILITGSFYTTSPARGIIREL
ncbi:MAG: hypothetical protein DRP84_01630 [Spirochaetes bacterium]|nr:MAG: hypothetical protein DRP84_01630 [Spirochaetota bacterium]